MKRSENTQGKANKENINRYNPSAPVYEEKIIRKGILKNTERKTETEKKYLPSAPTFEEKVLPPIRKGILKDSEEQFNKENRKNYLPSAPTNEIPKSNNNSSLQTNSNESNNKNIKNPDETYDSINYEYAPT